MRPIDLTGRRFGTLIVVEFSHRVEQYKHWKVKCDCGREFTARGSSLTSGNTAGCGHCFRKGNKNAWRHGYSPKGPRTETYNTWQSMKKRCYDPNATGYALWGGRGISMCDRWRNSFEAFLEDMGERPAGTTIDRWPNVNGNYEPGNVRWATPLQQRHNRRS